MTYIDSIASFSLLSALVGCAASPTDPSDLDAEPSDGKADDGAREPDAATRANLVAAIHADYLDAKVHGQANELVVSTMRIAGEFAWVTAAVQKRGGGDLDWTNSEFADAVEAGVFDGPSLQAMLKRTAGTWSVVEAAIGSTDVWWDGIWFRYPVSCGLFPGVASCPAVTTPVPGSADRRDLMRALHTQQLDAAVDGQANELVVSRLRMGGNYAFTIGRVQAAGGGEIDWTRTAYADAVANGVFDGPNLTALFERTSSGWRVHEMGIGATDVSWWGIWTRFADVPCALFPVSACPED